MDWLSEHMINRLTVVVSPTWLTCCNVQTQKVYYDVLADVAFDVVKWVSEALVRELRRCRSYVRAPITMSSLCITFSCKCPVTDDKASRWKVGFHHPPAALAYALFAADRPMHSRNFRVSLTSLLFSNKAIKCPWTRVIQAYIPVSLKADRTTAQRPHSLDDRAARLHALGTCLIMTAHRWLALISRLCGIVRPHIATAQQMMYAFHVSFIYYRPNRIRIGVKNTQIKTQMYQLMLALFGRLIYWRLQELKCDSCNK